MEKKNRAIITLRKLQEEEKEVVKQVELQS